MRVFVESVLRFGMSLCLRRSSPFTQFLNKKTMRFHQEKMRFSFFVDQSKLFWMLSLLIIIIYIYVCIYDWMYIDVHVKYRCIRMIEYIMSQLLFVDFCCTYIHTYIHTDRQTYMMVSMRGIILKWPYDNSCFQVSELAQNSSRGPWIA